MAAWISPAKVQTGVEPQTLLSLPRVGTFNVHSSHPDFGSQNRSVHRAGILPASMELSAEAGKEGPQTLGLFEPWQPKPKQILLTCVEVSPEVAEKDFKF